MWLTIYFFEENILLQRVHCHADCPVDGSLLAGALGVTVSRIFIVSAGTFGAGAGPKKKWLRFWAPHCKSFGNIEFRAPERKIPIFGWTCEPAGKGLGSQFGSGAWSHLSLNVVSQKLNLPTTAMLKGSTHSMPSYPGSWRRFRSNQPKYDLPTVDLRACKCSQTSW